MAHRFEIRIKLVPNNFLHLSVGDRIEHAQNTSDYPINVHRNTTPNLRLYRHLPQVYARLSIQDISPPPLSMKITYFTFSFPLVRF